jgi:hypothetical protein
MVYSNARTVTISGTPAFTNFVDCGSLGLVYDSSNTWGGSVNASTTRFSVTGNGVIQTFGAGGTYYPGGVSGTSANGGQYV